MANRRTQLMLSEAQKEELEEVYRETEDVRVRERVQAVRMASSGQYTQEEIATAIGCVRRTLQNWLEAYRAGGVDKLVARRKPGASRSPLQDASVQEQWKHKLANGDFRTALHMAQWLEAAFGIRRSVKTLYYWLKNIGAALRVPRPVNRKQDPQAPARFLAELEAKLRALPLEKGRPVRIWIEDEGRLGLHTIVRRCWGLVGQRVVKPTQRKYQWAWLYGAMEIGTGAFHCLWMPNVDLDVTETFLESLVELEPGAEHIVIWDGAGFHHKPDTHDLPDHIHVVQLPPYCPELSPIEKLWDILKDGLCNQVFHTLDELWEAFVPQVKPFYQPQRVHQLLGHHPILVPLNDSYKL